MQDIKLDNLELFYDVFEESNNFLYEIFHKPYFELIEMTAENILAGEVLTDFENKEDEEKLQEIYDKLENVDFSVEDVRKALQSIILRGFKELKIPNGNTTPDTLGIFMTYLITKLNKKKEMSIIDPLCGVGNLLFTISNHLDKKLNLFACDNDLWMTKLTKITADLLDTNIEIYYQDSMNLNLNNMDCVIFDMPHSEYQDNKYFPYEAILHYRNYLNDKGIMIGIVENDFFNYDKDQEFKKELLKDMSIIGICELPDNMFKASKPKIVIVLLKDTINKKSFMVKLPSFTDVKEFNESLREIEMWFENNKIVIENEEN